MAVKATAALGIPGESLRSRLPKRAQRLVTAGQFGGMTLDTLVFPYSPGAVVTKRALEKALSKLEDRCTALVVVGWDFTAEARAILDVRQAIVLSDREFGWTDATWTEAVQRSSQSATKPGSTVPALFDDESLTVARDFMHKGMPWDLSRPHFIVYLRSQIADKVNADPMFAPRLRQVALRSLSSDEPSVIRRALTALTFVGTDTDLPAVLSLTEHANTDVSKDARTCLYEIKRGTAGRGR